MSLDNLAKYHAWLLKKSLEMIDLGLGEAQVGLLGLLVLWHSDVSIVLCSETITMELHSRCGEFKSKDYSSDCVNKLVMVSGACVTWLLGMQWPRIVDDDSRVGVGTPPTPSNTTTTTIC